MNGFALVGFKDDGAAAVTPLIKGIPTEVARGSRAKLVKIERKLREGVSKESRLYLVQCALEIIGTFNIERSGRTVDLSRPLRTFLDRVTVSQPCVVKVGSLVRAAAPASFEADFDCEPGTRRFVPQSLADAQCALVTNWMLEQTLSPFYASVYSAVQGREAASPGATPGALPGGSLPGASTSPAIAIVYQQLDGSLEDLLRSDFFFVKKAGGVNWNRVAAMLAQIVFGIAQGHALARLVHNDLHAANIMYESVPDEHYLFYRFGRGVAATKLLAIPTHGCVYKQIDFGRASFVWPIGGDTSLTPAIVSTGRPLMVSDFWAKHFTQRHRLDTNRASTDLVRLAFELEYLLTDNTAGAAFDANDPASRLVHRLMSDMTRTVGGGTIRSKLHSLGLNDDADVEVKSFVWVPMIGANNPCACRPAREYLEFFAPLFGIDESFVPDDAVIYELVE